MKFADTVVETMAGWRTDQINNTGIITKPEQEVPLLATGQARPQMRQADGANIPEFTIALFALVFCGLIPLSNLIAFGSSYISIRQLTLTAARRAAMADNRQMSLSCVDSLNSDLKQPLLCALHTVTSQNTDLNICVVDNAGNRSVFSANESLPLALRPTHTKDSRKLSYSYQVNLQCKITPFFNLSGIPFVGQVPIIGAASSVAFSSEVPIEYPLVLNK